VVVAGAGGDESPGAGGAVGAGAGGAVVAGAGGDESPGAGGADGLGAINNRGAGQTNGLANVVLLANTTPNVLARGRICRFAAERRMPAVSTEKVFAAAGCLMSYGEDQLNMSRQAAGYAARILKGAKPADLPVQQPTKFELVINLKTAKALGLDVPETLLATADELIK